MKRLVLLGLAFAMGCNAAYSNEDILFLKALPRGLSIDLPGAEESTTANGLRAAQFDGDHAKFRRDAQKGADDVNALIDEVFKHVYNVVENIRPTAEDEMTRVWGPFPIEDGMELALVITNTRTSTSLSFVDEGPLVASDDWFTYYFAIRPQGGTEAQWRAAIAGQSLPVEGTEHGAGRLIFDTRIFNDGSAGVLAIGYDTVSSTTGIDVYFDANPMAGGFAPDAAWQYRRFEDESVRFIFALLQNLPTTGPTLELFLIVSRWFPDGRGRADAAVTGGDLNGVTFAASECWNSAFERLFFWTNIPGQQDQNTGTPRACGPGLVDPAFPDSGR